jgi:hypothetical protein
MALTRRFFTDLARKYREAKPQSHPDSTEVAVWAHMVVITANALAVQNAMFNFEKFYEACGLERVGTPTP